MLKFAEATGLAFDEHDSRGSRSYKHNKERIVVVAENMIENIEPKINHNRFVKLFLYGFKNDKINKRIGTGNKKIHKNDMLTAVKTAPFVKLNTIIIIE